MGEHRRLWNDSEDVAETKTVLGHVIDLKSIKRYRSELCMIGDGIGATLILTMETRWTSCEKH